MIVMPTATYRALATALLNIKPDWFAETVDEDAVKLVLGEIGDIWPASLFEPVDHANEPVDPPVDHAFENPTDAELVEVFGWLDEMFE